MKKRISLIIAVLMLMNLFPCWSSAQAAELLEGTYEFIDTAYDPTNGVYLAVAKDFANDNHPAQVLRSTDAANWEVVKSFDLAKNYANSYSRQNLVWWQDANVFILMTGGVLYSSPDGITWTRRQAMERGNAAIETNGKQLLVAGGKAAKLVNPEELEADSVFYHLFDSNDATYAHVVGITPENESGEKKCLIANTWQLWSLPGTWDEGENTPFTNVAVGGYTQGDADAGAGADKGRTPYDMVYEPVSAEWLDVNDTTLLRVITQTNAHREFKIGGDDVLVTAAGAGHGLALAGKADGRLYVTAADAAGLNKDTVWEQAVAGDQEMTDEVRSITPIDQERFLIATKTNLYLGSMTEEGFVYDNHDTSYVKLGAGETRIEVPAEGSEEYTYTFGCFNLADQPVGEAIATVEVTGDVPEGVSVDGSTLTVASTAPAGVITLQATSETGKQGSVEIKLVREASVVIEGFDSVAIPDSGSNTQPYTAYILATDGERMNRTPVLTAEELPQGVTFDPATGILTVAAGGKGGMVVLKAASATDPSIYITKQIEIKGKAPGSVRLEGEWEITVDGSMSKHTYQAMVVDQMGNDMPDQEVTWSISGLDTGASIDQEGMLSIYGVSKNTSIKIRATSKEAPRVFGEKTITIKYQPAGSGNNDVIPSSDYEFIDTAYSETLGVYVAVAKTGVSNSNATSHSGEIYSSTDGTHWKKTLSVGNAMNSKAKKSRQNLVWWEGEQTFIAAFAGTVYASPDGFSWTKKDNLSVASNLNVSTNGTKLLIGAENNLYLADSVDGQPQIIPLNSKYTATLAGMDNKEPTRYVVVSRYVTWGKTEGDSAFNEVFPDISAEPTDVQYSPALDRWLVINEKEQLRVLNYPASYAAMNLKLSDGTTNGDPLVAVCAGTDANVTGTRTGALYLHENDGKAFTADAIWNIVGPAEGTDAISTEIRSISQIAEGLYLAASMDQLYMITKKEDTWKYYKLVEDKAVLPEDQVRIEVPFEGSEDIIYAPQAIDYKGDVSDNQVIGFYPISQLPAGVTFEFGGNYGGGVSKLTVDSSVSADASLTMQALFADGSRSDCTLSFVREVKTVLTMNDELPLPAKEAESWNVAVAVVGTDGKPMKRDATVKMEEAPEGVTFDPATMQIRISREAKAGQILMVAYPNNLPEEKETKTIPLGPIYPKTVKITRGESAITIPDGPNEGYPYDAAVYDQAARIIKNSPIAWSVSGEPGVRIADNGVLTIPTSLYDSTIEITAASQERSESFAKMEVTLTISDYRHTVEDAKKLERYFAQSGIDFSNLTEDITLPTENITLPGEPEWGCTVKWVSSDSQVITGGGAITRNAKSNKTANLTASILYNDAKSTKVFPVTVIKSDNLFENGTVETGKTEGFTSEGELTVVEENTHGNSKYALQVKGNSVSMNNPLEKDSAYVYEVFVNAKKGSVITMKSKAFGTRNTVTAEDGYTRISGFINTVKAAEDIITIQVDGVEQFLLDDARYFDVTEEYDAIMRAIANAKYSKKISDVEKAIQLISEFYDVPERQKWLDELGKIDTSTKPDSRPSGNGGGGGGGGSVSPGNRPAGGTAPIVTTPTQAQDQDEKVSDYFLIFKDLKNHWAKDDIEAMAEKEIVSGRADGVFDPEAPVTRAEFAVLVSKTMGLSEVAYENTFFDIVGEDWYSGYVQAAKNEGYVGGSNGLYRPNDEITREEIAKIVVSAYAQKTGTQIETGGALYYSDLADISSWAYDYIVNAVNLGFVKGINEYSFAPKATATRAQAVVMLKRLLDKLPQ